MKIRAIRLSQFGCFEAPHRVENFSGKLDVLAGPNELGKSTLLDALMAVFTEKHSTRSTTSALGRRVPYAGGTPRIEVDFELGGEAYRLRKQFLSKPMAELSTAAGSNVLARNDEVEEKLKELFGSDKGPAAKTGLLWLGQGETLQPLDLKDDENNILRALLERDIVDIGGGSRARPMSVLIEKDLAAVITPGRGQPTGDYKSALGARDNAARALEKAREEIERAEEGRKKLDAARAALKTQTSSEVMDKRARRLTNADKDYDQAREATFKLQGAEERVEHLKLAKDKCEVQRARLIATLENMSSLDLALVEGRQAREEAEARVKNSDALLTELEAKNTEFRAKINGLAETRQMLDAREELNTLLKRETGITDQIDKARIELAAETRVHAALKALPVVTSAGIAAIEGELVAITRLEDQLDRATTKIRVHYEKGASGFISRGGEPVPDGAVIEARVPTILDIKGVGRIEIDPGPSAAREDVVEDIKVHQAQLAHLLGEINLANASEARTTLVKRQELDLELTTIRVRLDGIAPGGVDGLEAEKSQITSQLVTIGDVADIPPAQDGSKSRNEITEELNTLRALESTYADEFRSAHEARNKAQNELSRLDEQLQYRQRELEKLKKDLPDNEAARATELERLADALKAKIHELGEAVQLVQSYRDCAPDGEQKAKLETERDLARAAFDNHQHTVQQLKENIAALSAGFGHGGELKGVTGIAELETHFERHQARVAKFETDIAALRLLQSELERAMGEVRATYLEPVKRRIEPYFKSLFPNAEFDLGYRFSIGTIQRAQGREALAKLSFGTREQISVLTRLGFGRLLADQGTPLPLILDDALIYSDDQRLGSLFGVLNKAAEHHQVIMLTCRTASFEGLDGHRLEIEPGDF